MAQLLAPVVCEIRERAAASWRRLRNDFPGNTETGLFDANDEWRAWFFERHRGLACPVLDEETGSCRLYEFRPVCCRIYGPLIQIGAQISDPCPLCYPGVPPNKVEACRVRVDVSQADLPLRETMIAYVLSR